LQRLYADALSGPLPDDMLALLHQLASIEAVARQRTPDAD